MWQDDFRARPKFTKIVPLIEDSVSEAAFASFTVEENSNRNEEKECDASEHEHLRGEESGKVTSTTERVDGLLHEVSELKSMLREKECFHATERAHFMEELRAQRESHHEAISKKDDRILRLESKIERLEAKLGY